MTLHFNERMLLAKNKNNVGHVGTECVILIRENTIITQLLLCQELSQSCLHW